MTTNRQRRNARLAPKPPAHFAKVPQSLAMRLHPDQLEELGRKPPKSAPTEAPPVKMGRATVAPGRSVDLPVRGERQLVGYQRESLREVFGPLLRQYGPGAEIELPLDEIARLRRLGFLLQAGEQMPVTPPPGSPRREGPGAQPLPGVETQTSGNGSDVTPGRVASVPPT